MLKEQLLKLGVSPNSIPMSFGYEVTPLLPDASSVDNNDIDSKEVEGILSHDNSPSFDCGTLSGDQTKASSLGKDGSLRVSVTLTSDKKQFVDNRESNHVVLESNGTSTYCISENAGEEEGMEVIGLGRYNTMEEETEAFEEHLLETASSESLDVDDRLKQAFSPNERIQVAFYRPDPAITKVEYKSDGLKCKEE
ncbi:MAG: hypothetical protein SGILL_006215 [Bacillariaceae sp.]